MITLFTLYTIIENRRKYNDDYGGYYLGHDETKVLFGFIYPLKPRPLTSFKLKSKEVIEITGLSSYNFTYNNVMCLTFDKKYPFRIPNLDDINFIKNSLSINRKINLRCWLKNYDTQKLFIYDASYKGENLFDNVIDERAHILLIRYVDILKC